MCSCCGQFCATKDREEREGSERSRTNRKLENLGIAKINGETIATTSNLKNYLICLHTEEATGSIPVSPTIFSTSLSRFIPLDYPTLFMGASAAVVDAWLKQD
jgi:hypothetical protein